MPKTKLAIVACVDFVFANQIPQAIAAVETVTTIVALLQLQEKLYDIVYLGDDIANTYMRCNATAANAKLRRNGKRPANVGAGVVLFGNGEDFFCVHADGEAPFQSEQTLLNSDCDLLANAHRSQFQSEVMVHGTE